MSILFTYFIKGKTNSIKNKKLHFNSQISAIYFDVDFWIVAFFWGKRIIFLSPEILKVLRKGVCLKWNGPHPLTYFIRWGFLDGNNQNNAISCVRSTT